MSVESVKLASVATINPSPGKNEITSDELVAFVPMASVSADPPVVEVAEELKFSSIKTGFSYFQNHDILVAKITPCFENGKIAQAVINQSHGFGSTEFHVVRANKFKADSRYILHYLRQDYIRLDGERKMTGSAGQRRVPKHFLENLDIPLPPIAEQKRIAAILDQAEELRSQRRRAIGLLDELARSVFLEMFGDPANCRKEIESVSFSEITTRITDGTHLTPEFIESGVPFIFVRNFKNGSIDFQTDKFISEAEYQKLHKRCPIEEGDVLYTTVGATYGQAALVGSFTKFSFQRHVAHLKPDKNKILPKFLSTVMQMPLVKAQADRQVRGAAQPTLNLTELREFVIPLPPLPLQQEFAQRIEAIEALKITHQQSLAHLDALFASLQHRAFRGEL